MKKDDIILINIERPETFLSNSVLIEKKCRDKICVQPYDCQDVNKNIYATHGPNPTTGELRHELKR